MRLKTLSSYQLCRQGENGAHGVDGDDDGDGDEGGYGADGDEAADGYLGAQGSVSSTASSGRTLWPEWSFL